MRLGPDALAFVRERHLAVLVTIRDDGSPHAVPVGFTWDDETGVARVITSGTSVKARNVRALPTCALTQVDGRRWLTLEGAARVRADPSSVADAERRYTERYRPPRENPRRVVIEIDVTRVLGRP